jgi:hypothetical protein
MFNFLFKNKFKLMTGVVVLISIWFCYSLLEISAKNQILKTESAEIKSIKYGLFSVEQWKNQLFLIVTDQINDFDIKDNKKTIKPIVEMQLRKLIDTVDKKIRQKNSESVGGRFKQAFINTFVNMDEVKSGVPEYADEIIQIMEKRKVKRKVQNMLQDKVEVYFDKTFQHEDKMHIDLILARTGSQDVDEARSKLQAQINDNNRQISILAFGFLIFSAVMFSIFVFLTKKLNTYMFLTLVTLLAALLVTGVSMPMIDLEAKISEMSFVLLEHPVKFTDQIIYFQSKSVLDVFKIMISHPDAQMKIVGILIVMFSVVFPLFKLLSSVFYYFDFKGLRKNKIVQFFVLKSGKWSMTDVMIIAIFMAYIGFNGIISSQLDGLSSNTQELMLLATNGTTLQAGFFLFFFYALFSLVFSEMIVHKEYAVVKEKPKVDRENHSRPIENWTPQPNL